MYWHVTCFERDLPGTVSNSELGFILRLEEVTKKCIHIVQVLECSARTGAGLKEVSHWIQDNCKASS